MNLIASEFLKVRSTRLWWALLLGALIYTAMNAAITASFAGVDLGAGQGTTPELDEPGMIRSVYAGAAIGGSYILVLVLGITAMTAEYRYRTITPTFLVTPKRSRVVAAKAVAQVVFGLGFGAAAMVVAFVVGGTVILIRGFDLGLGTDQLWRAVVLGVVAIGLWALIGLGLGTLIRNQIAAIMVGVFIVLLVEPLLGLGLNALDLDWVSRWLPANASTALVTPDLTDVNLLPWWGGGLVMLAYAAIFAGIGILLSRRRDIS